MTTNNRSRTRQTHISRRSWLRIVATLMGVMLLAMQTVPVLAGSTISRSSYEDISYQLGKEETGYGLGGVQSAAAASALTSPNTPSAGSFAAPQATSLNSSNSIDILESAVNTLRESQQPSDERENDEPADAPVADESSDEPADDATDQTPAADTDLAQAGEPALVVSDDFMSAGNVALWTGESNGNEVFVSEEDGGWYVMLVQPGILFPVIATGDMMITDGAIVADARFAGGGAGDMGVFGRSTVEADAYYYCLIDVYGGAGCYLLGGGQWSELFYLAPGEVTRYQMDRLTLDISGSTLTFSVNEEVVGSYTDAAVTGGSWGLATGCYEGNCSGNFDFVDIYSYATTGNEVPMTTVVATDFSDAPADAFFTAQGDWGFAEINDGWYTVSLAPGFYVPNPINGTETIDNGIITADVAFDGDGAFGVIARMSTNDEGYSSYYVCWVNTSAFANCHVIVDDVWYELEGSAGVTVALEEVNRLSLGIDNDHIFFGVNGQLVTDAYDNTLTVGSMGFYHEAFTDSTGYFTSFVDAVTVEAIGGSDNFQAVLASDLNVNDLGLYVGSGDWGFADFIYDGYYTTELNPGWSFANPLVGTASVESGLIKTVVEFGGHGSTGLIARTQDSEAGLSYYVCWIDAGSALAGCHLVLNGEWYTLGVTEQPLELNSSNELVMAVNGSEIYFMVNGEIVIEAVDDTLATGDWGLYSDSAADGEGSWSDTDSITIEEYTGS